MIAECRSFGRRKKAPPRWRGCKGLGWLLDREEAASEVEAATNETEEAEGCGFGDNLNRDRLGGNEIRNCVCSDIES